MCIHNKKSKIGRIKFYNRASPVINTILNFINEYIHSEKFVSFFNRRNTCASHTQIKSEYLNIFTGYLPALATMCVLHILNAIQIF